MSGFSVPTQLRTANWWPGGPYYEKQKVHELASPSAYTPHTVFLVESRYPIRREGGRPETVDHFVGVCREEEYPAIMERLNSSRAPANLAETMDNAQWPWLDAKKARTTKWMDKDETMEILRKIDEVDHQDTLATLAAEASAAPQPSQSSRSVPKGQLRATELLMPQRLSGQAQQRRVFHFSVQRTANGDPSKPPAPGSFAARKQIPTSSWARPHKPSQDADDNVVPSYYVERKRQRSEIAERKEEEGGLMAELNAGILSEGLAAETKPREEKIPVEVRDLKEGGVFHPSGFQPPTPETEFHPSAAKKPVEDHPLVKTVKQRWDTLPTEQESAKRVHLRDQAERDAAEVLRNLGTQAEPPAGTVSPLSGQVLTRRQREENTSDDVVPSFYVERKRQRDDIDEEEKGGLMAELNAGILSDGLAAEVRVQEQKIPVEVFIPEEGRVRHPSGFEPPTAETAFHPAAAKTPTEEHPVIATKKVPWHEQDVLNASSNGTGNGVSSSGSGSRGLHTSAVLRAVAVSDSAFGFMSHAPMRAPEPVFSSQPKGKPIRRQELFEDEETIVKARSVPSRAVREQYLPTLAVMTQTRPLALSIEQLSRSNARGLPYHATLDSKYGPSLGARIPGMRMNRTHALVTDLARLLKGERGGILGIRWDAQSRGRGRGGEGMAESVPVEKRMIKVGIAEWYAHSEEWKVDVSAMRQRDGRASG